MRFWNKWVRLMSFRSKVIFLNNNFFSFTKNGVCSSYRGLYLIFYLYKYNNYFS
jgi:hypothetical protein